MSEEVKEYLLFYLKFETIGNCDDLMAIGVTKSSMASEQIRAMEIADRLSALLAERDSALRAQSAYCTGIGDVGVSFQHFGPVMLAFLPVLNEESVKSLYALMALTLPRVIRKMGCQGRFVRGAFVKGFGWEIAEGNCSTLYGPIMHKAWHTLTEMAYSPRIIIEEEIYEILSQRESFGPGKDGDWLPMYVKRDYDGQGILHYLAHDRTSPFVLHDGIENVITEMKVTLATIVGLTQRISSQHKVHDGSAAIRMALALEDYVGNSICEWTKADRGKVMRDAWNSSCKHDRMV